MNSSSGLANLKEDFDLLPCFLGSLECGKKTCDKQFHIPASFSIDKDLYRTDRYYEIPQREAKATEEK